MKPLYIPIVSKYARCESCDGTGRRDLDDQYEECPACDGHGRTKDLVLEPLHFGENRVVHIYDEPGKATRLTANWASARTSMRAPLAHEVRIIDLDDCEAYERGWTEEQKFQRAERRMLYWYDKMNAALQRMNAPAYEFKVADPSAKVADDKLPTLLRPWCENCGDAFDGPERDCPHPSPGRPYKECGRGGHMFRLQTAPKQGR